MKAKISISCALVFIVVYLSTAFILLQMDCRKWDYAERFGFLSLSALFSWVAIGIILKNHNKELK